MIKYFSLCFCLLFLLGCRNASNNNAIKTTKTEADTIKIVDTTVIGMAVDFKGGPQIEDDTCIYYVREIQDWDENVYGKIVKVSGKLIVIDYYPQRNDSEEDESEEAEDTITRICFDCETIVQRAQVECNILNPKWELVDTTKKK